MAAKHSKLSAGYILIIFFPIIQYQTVKCRVFIPEKAFACLKYARKINVFRKGGH